MKDDSGMRSPLYHTLHLDSSAGFIFDPTGQLKSLAKPAMLEKAPWTLNWSGEWVPVTTESLRAWGLDLEHHTLAPLIQNICWGEKSRPGSLCSSPFLSAQESTKCHQLAVWH